MAKPSEREVLAEYVLKLSHEVRARVPDGHLVKRWIDDAETAARAVLAAPAPAAVEEALEWYAERARSMRRYMESTPPQVTAMTAVAQELSLDNGQRAALARRPKG